jgi:GNAT superfamily N-acetyltransferase
MYFRNIGRDEIGRIWQEIDRRELVRNIYRVKNDELFEEKVDFDVKGWPPGEERKYMPLLQECYDRGGFFHGAFHNEKLIGVVVLESKLIGKRKDQLQLKFLHVSRDFRRKGLGTKLFLIAANEARKRGAKQLYVSSCESKNTVDFWLRRGCVITDDLDEELYRLEPEDIHLVYRL